MVDKVSLNELKSERSSVQKMWASDTARMVPTRVRTIVRGNMNIT